MTYDPFAPTQVDRSRTYNMVWIGAACSIYTFANYFIGWEGLPTAIIFGGATGGVLGSVLTGRTDEYHRSLCAMGHRWAIFMLASYMFAAWLFQIADISYGAGYASIVGAKPDSGPAFAKFLFDGYFLAIVLSLVFYAGYAYAWGKDYLGRGDQQ